MAGHPIPYSAFPDINPAGAPQNDFEHINATPDMFGGLIAQGEERLGSGVEKTSDNVFDIATQRARIDDQTHASELHSWFSDQATGLISNFSQLQGKAALEQLPQFKQKLQQLQTDAEGQADNPLLKSMVAVNTRNTMDRFNNWLVGHADSQRQQWYKTTAQNNITSATGTGGMAILNNDYPTLDRQFRVIDQEAHNYYEAFGYDPDTLKTEVSKYKGNAVKNWVETAATNDKDPDNIHHAMQIFERYTGELDPNSRLQISKYLNTRAQARSVNRLADYYIGGANSSPLMSQIVESAGKYGIDPLLLSRQLNQESGLNPNVRASSAGAQGVAQFMPATAQRYGVNVHDAASSIDGAAHYMADLKTQFGGNDGLALAGYNWGEQHVAQWLASGANPSAMPLETRNYVRSITGHPIDAWVSGNVQSNTKQIDVDDVVSRIQADPAFNDRPELQQSVIKTVLAKASVSNRVAAITAKQSKDQSEQSELNIFKRIHTDDKSLTINDILNNPQMTPEAKMRMTTAFEARGGNVKADHTYGTGFYDLYRRVHLPEGNPDRITDPNQLYSHVGPTGDLTVGGVDKLAQEIQSRRSPEGVAESEMKAQFLKNARSQITGKSEHLGFVDHKGDELYLKFLADFFPAYEAARRQGKPAAQILNPDSPEYLGKAIDNFKRPQTEWFSDVIKDNPELAPDGTTPAKSAQPFDIKTVKTLADATEALKADRISPKQARELVGLHPEWGVNLAPQAPMPQVPISR